MQKLRAKKLVKIKRWLNEAGGIEAADINKFVRRICIVFGCTRKKAIEYLSEITGEDY